MPIVGTIWLLHLEHQHLMMPTHLLQSIRGLRPQLLISEVDDMDGDAIYSEDLQQGLRVGQKRRDKGVGYSTGCDWDVR